jgi:superoxide dismutase, Cu-Zn family
MIRSLMLTTLSLPMIGCMAAGDSSGPAPAGQSSAGAQATLLSADGATRGTATFSESPAGITVHAEAQGLPPGVHGIHVHTTGRCDAPDFQTAGPHWNPTSRQHGRENPQGAHRGDLPNISIGPNGRGMLHSTLSAARFAELFDADGAALIIHANADDDRSDPSGNSGGRIACGVIARQ